MLNFYMVSSGSRGNSTIIWDENDLIVIDCGITLKKFMEKTSNFDLKELEKSIFISHEHSDHSSGVRTLSKKISADVYSKEKTLSRLGYDNAFPINGEVAVGNFSIIPVSIRHDAVDPVAYVVKNRGIKIAVVSDLGIVESELLDEIYGADIIALEANHDLNMLATGPYPEHLKNRIRSNYGHLSNEQSAEAIYNTATVKAIFWLIPRFLYYFYINGNGRIRTYYNRCRTNGSFCNISGRSQGYKKYHTGSA